MSHESSLPQIPGYKLFHSSFCPERSEAIESDPCMCQKSKLKAFSDFSAVKLSGNLLSLLLKGSNQCLTTWTQILVRSFTSYVSLRLLLSCEQLKKQKTTILVPVSLVLFHLLFPNFNSRSFCVTWIMNPTLISTSTSSLHLEFAFKGYFI